jgi:PKD repeat protein
VWRHNLWSTFPGQAIYNPSSDVIDAEAGLVNIDAPVAAGVVTAEPYKLAGDSIAINRGIRRDGTVTTDYWGVRRDGAPDIGANEFPNGSGDEPIDEPSLPPAGTRVTEGLLALYDFKQGSGLQIRDVSGVGDPLHLRLMDGSRAEWTAHGLEITQPVLITSERPATKIINACRQSAEITLEAWIMPANVSQDGPARIISLSNSKTQRNVTLGQGLHGNQPTDLFMARLRTTRTSTNGLPAVITPAGSATPALTHVVYTRRNNNEAKLFINGQERGVLEVGGDFSNWDDRMPLLLADELSEDRPWLGLYHLVAVYGRALLPAEVLHNYEASFTGDVPLAADFSILPGDAHGVVPHMVEFDAADTISMAGISAYFWEFGDGQTSNRAAPVYTYTSPGSYTVSLTVTDANGLTDKITKERLITVVETPVTPLPPEFARFILINLQSSTVVGFGLQYPNLRCHVMWNEDPYHTLTFATIEDVRRNYTTDNALELVWVDELEEV